MLKFLKQNALLIFLIIFIVLDVVITLPYSIYRTGGTLDICEKLSNKEYDCTKINSTYVNVLDGKLTNLLIALLMPNWDIISNDDIILDTEDITAANEREKLYLYEAISSATYNAYHKANKELDIKGTHIYVAYITKDANTDLKVGDEIKEINGIKINNVNDVYSLIESSSSNEVNILVNRKNIDVLTTSKLYKSEDGYKVGISLITTYDYGDSTIKYQYENNESGSSGGLMLSLAMYNSLIEENINSNLNICGTGTIGYDGVVGDIGGVKYKMAGASKNKCDVFIIPTDNYEEAKQELEKNDYKMKLIEAHSFDQVLNEIKTLN